MSEFTASPPPQPRAARRALAAALERPRYEVLPLDGAAEQVAHWVAPNATVTVTASPRRGLGPTLDLAERLAAKGYRVVPHLAARQVADTAHLAAALERLEGAGIREAFAVGGDPGRAEEPAGAFPDALALLEAMAALGRAKAFRVGVPAYPEGHPFIARAELDRALRAKRRHADYLVTQMCFDARAIAAWLDGGGHLGLPVHVGLAGPVNRAKLLRIALRIGVGASVRFLRAHSRLASGGYYPGELAGALAPRLAEHRGGLHIYTLGDVAAAERWRRRTLQDLKRGWEPGR